MQWSSLLGRTSFPSRFCYVQGSRPVFRPNPPGQGPWEPMPASRAVPGTVCPESRPSECTGRCPWVPPGTFRSGSGGWSDFLRCCAPTADWPPGTTLPWNQSGSAKVSTNTGRTPYIARPRIHQQPAARPRTSEARFGHLRPRKDQEPAISDHPLGSPAVRLAPADPPATQHRSSFAVTQKSRDHLTGCATAVPIRKLGRDVSA